MRLGVLDWMLAGSTVALCIVLLAAPVVLTPKLSFLYGLHGALEGRGALSRLMMSRWLPPLMAAGPIVVAVWCTVTRMTPRPRRGMLAAALLGAVLAATLFVLGLVAPIVSAAAGR